MTSSWPPWRLRARLRVALARAVLIAAALVVLLGVLRAGTRFFYCPVTHLAFDAPPCSREPSAAERQAGFDEDLDAPALRSADCCEEKWRPAAPTAAATELSLARIPPASVVAVLAAGPASMAPLSARMPFAIAPHVRAGPPPPDGSDRQAELMVFRN